MEIIHVLNRGVDKRKIFLKEKDYLRFVHNLFIFNDSKNINNNIHLFQKHHIDIGCRYRDILVNIYAFCLMPNHYHLLISPVSDKGISHFMKKINMGYAKYFNKKYNRSGALFQGKYKSITVNREDHFLYLPYYIHFNPLDLSFPEWRNNKIKNHKKALNFIGKYRWSSHLDYTGKENFPLIINKDFLLGVFDGVEKYNNSVKQFIKEMEFNSFNDVTLE